jgi:hypothetical protein
LRKALLHLVHQLPDASGSLDCIGARQLVNGDECGGLAIQASNDAVILLSHFDAGDIFNSDDSAIRSFTDDDLFKLLGRRQTALRENGIRELLVRGGWFAALVRVRIRVR